jgi:hypothetical protein
VVDNFGIKYDDTKHATHLVAALKQHYYEAISEDWHGSLFCGIKLAWNYIDRTVNLSMPGYINQALHKFQHRSLQNLNILPINITIPSTEPKSNSLNQPTHRHPYPRKESSDSNKS